MMKIQLENKSAVTLHGQPPGATFTVDADDNGTPLDAKWRRRLRDSEIDGAITQVAQEDETWPE